MIFDDENEIIISGSTPYHMIIAKMLIEKASEMGIRIVVEGDMQGFELNNGIV